MKIQTSFKKTILASGLMFLALPVISSCELTQNNMKHDRENNFEVQDYRDALAPRQVDIDEGADASGKIPELKPYVAQPDLNYKPMPLVSISVNQTIPLRDVIYEVTNQAGYDAEIDPRIKGSIIFSARNRPLDMVIDRIAEIAGLRYKFEDDMLRVELDTPYHETYKINYLSLTRTNKSTINNNVSVVKGEGSDTGSSFSASNESVLDFWKELETNLTQIVGSNRDTDKLTTKKDPKVTVADSNPAPVEPIVMDANGNIAQTGPNVQVQAPAAVLNVAALDEEDDNNSGNKDPFEARFSLNKQSGLVAVFAPERLQKKVSAYLDELKKSATSQVLIEAKVLEVTLNDGFDAGIDWSQVDINLFGGNGGIGFGQTGVGGLVQAVVDGRAEADAPDAGRIGYSKAGFNAAASALSKFGTVQALASPRLTVLNNQSAALNVAENVVYFEVESEVTQGDSGAAQKSFTTTAKTVPIGVLINVQPAIDLDLKRVSMAIRPTITNITDSIPDPNPDLGEIENNVPQVNVQEFDSIIQMENGQAVVLGGLIQDKVTGNTSGVPVLSETPVIGGLFRKRNNTVKKTELVVFLRATIVEGDNTIHNTDRDLYRTFSSDRRPFKL